MMPAWRPRDSGRATKAFIAAAPATGSVTDSVRTAATRGLLVAGLSHGLSGGELDPRAQAPLDGVEVGVDHRRDVERDQLGKREPAHHREAQGAARLRPGAQADGDG